MCSNQESSRNKEREEEETLQFLREGEWGVRRVGSERARGEVGRETHFGSFQFDVSFELQ